MPRKISMVTITDDGRDKGKVFRLTEMPASQAEEWATRALQGLVKSGIDLPEDAMSGGMSQLATLGIKALAGIAWTELRPLMAEMFSCVTIMPDPTGNPAFSRALVENDIEEVMTRLQLRATLWFLHVGFFLPGLPSTWTSATAFEAS